MTPGVGRPIPNRFLKIAVCLMFVGAARLSFAQHASGHVAGGAVHMSAPPVYRAPISAPVFHAPVLSPRISSMRPASGFVPPSFFPPRRPVRPFPPPILIYDFPFPFGNPFFGFNCWWATCDMFWPGMIEYNTISSPGPSNYVAQVYETSSYDYGLEAQDTPQLYLKDGTVLNVTDYWLVDDQLHFTIVQEYGTKPSEEVIPFEALDLQKTVDANTQRGFRFVLRNEPLEQYVRDHPEGPPPALTPQP